MPRPVALLLLIVALAGPMLTHAEAADDLARTLIGVRDQGRIEAPDGGIGDDPNVASVSRSTPLLDTLPHAMPVWEFLQNPSPLALLPPDPATNRRRRSCCSASWPFPTEPRRAAWLQVFLH